MFYRKLVALLLLGFYGIPAALGPYWHHHGCADHACVSQEHLSQQHPSRSQLAGACVESAVEKASHHCSCHHHVRPSAVKQTHKPMTWSQACQAHDGPCAICTFYASAQVLPLSYEYASHRELVSIIGSPEPSLPSVSLTVAQARGPPSCGSGC